MPHEGGPDGNIVSAIEKMEQTLGEKIDSQTAAIKNHTDAIERVNRNLGEKIDGETEALRELVRINAGVLALLERADIKIAD